MTRAGWASAWQSLLVPRLEQVRADHARAILAFERENRAYFATWISDRGDEYFDQFTARHRELLAEQDAGECAFYVLVEWDGEVLGRFNLYDIQDGAAKLGYRVAQRVAGCGVATTSVGELCEIAKSLGVGVLTAATSPKCRFTEGIEEGRVRARRSGGSFGTRAARRVSDIDVTSRHMTVVGRRLQYRRCLATFVP